MLEGRLVPMFVLIMSISSARADEVSALPDPIMTPGAVSTSDLGIICHQRTRERRRVPTSRCDAVFDAYSIPNTPIDRYSYECDHLVPLALGGSNAAANLWPQPNVEAERKDRLEVVMQRMVCAGSLQISQAQSEIADDWTAAYRRYVLGTDPPVASTSGASSITKRLTSFVRRLSHSWRFGSE